MGSSPSKTHNMEFRTGTIQTVCAELDRMDEEIFDLNEVRKAYRHKHIKGDLQMKIGDFDAFRRSYNMEEERRNEFLDALREGFTALNGKDGAKQLDWIEADKRIKAKTKAQAKAAQESEGAEADAADAGPVGDAD